MNCKNILLAGCCLLLLSSCSLDYENKGAINPDNVWRDKTMISGFLTDIYGNMLPGWPISANNTDEGMNGPTNMSDYARGMITVENQGQGLGYGNIDKINFFLEHIENNEVLTAEERNQLKGQALFWRAWDYWGKVFAVGGVPLILHTQDVINDLPSLFVKRSSTSECVAQILKDIDEAIALLPEQWDDANYGRIDKGCAMAFKGRVLLQYASPLFNPQNDSKRWEDAYNANKAAVNFLRSVGKDLYQGNFEDIWYEEQNCEVIMVNQFYYPDHALDQKDIRPECITKDMADQNQAIFPLVMAFPKADGTNLELDIERLKTDDAYNQQFLADFYMDRDPRFYATIFSPGTEYPTEEEILAGGKKLWNAWQWIENEQIYKSLIGDELPGKGKGAGEAGFYQKKGVDKSITAATVYQAETDWIEIRFAEVLMNYGECANELGNEHQGEALDVLYQIRKRAGVGSEANHYGITASSQDEIREAYMNERFIEFAYEGKRWADLRRWKRYDILNEMKYRSTLRLVVKDYDATIAGGKFDWTKDMYDPEVRKLFRFDYIECVDGDTQYQFNLDLNHWFYPIKREDLERNPNLEQNSEWGGKFDPLK